MQKGHTEQKKFRDWRHSAMLRKDVVQSCDTQCTEGDCDVILIEKLIISYYNAKYMCIYFIHN